MTPDRRSEIQTGYILKELSPVGAKFYMPESWFFKPESVPGTHAYFMTRERISGEPRTLGQGRFQLRTTTPEGFFTTGLSVNVHDNAGRRLGMKASDMARGFLRKPPPTIIPTSQPTEKTEGDLVVARRLFRTHQLVVSGRSSPPKTLYIELTGNTRTDTLYIIIFETPSDKWTEDREIASTMVDRRILDERI